MNKFEINIELKIIEEILDKVASFNWNKLPDNNNWSLGANKKVMQEVCQYWISDYDWQKEEKKINGYNFNYNICICCNFMSLYLCYNVFK